MSKITTRVFSRDTFKYFSELTENNNREWFHDNRDWFDEKVQAPFELFIETLSTKLENTDMSLTGSRKTLMRMHRDLRFSKDKTPYRTGLSAMLSRTGTKMDGGPVLYIQISAEGGFAGTGYYKLPTSDLNQIRQTIIDKSETFSAIKSGLSKNNLAFRQDNKLKTAPRGFSDFLDHDHIEELKLKSLLLHLDLSIDDWTQGKAMKKIQDFLRSATPFLKFAQVALKDRRDA